MTTAALNYLTYLENVRSHKAQEDISNRTLNESIRHSLADEALRSRTIDETIRSNLAKESEAHRANIAKETEAMRSNIARELETSRSNLAKEAETNRSNLAREAEQYRANNVSEYLKQESALYSAVKGSVYEDAAAAHAADRIGVSNIAQSLAGGSKVIREITGTVGRLLKSLQ